MKLGLRLPQRLGVDLQHDLVEAARTAEAAGYASLWTYEQLLFAETPVEPYAPPNVPWPEAGGRPPTPWQSSRQRRSCDRRYGSRLVQR